MLARWALLLLVLPAAPIGAAAAETRLALIITNSTYSREMGPLENTHRDGEVLAGALRKVGFADTRVVRDANQQRMRLEIAEFIERIDNAGGDAIAFFYYSGHGAADRSDRGENYVIPVEAPITLAKQLPIMAVSLGDIIKSVERSKAKARFVVIDACRNVAFAQGLKDAAKGFVPERKSDGIIIAFATRPGDTARDNNAYSGALAEALETPGLDATAVFKEAQLKVASLTGGAQIPWIEDGLLFRFRFTEPTRRADDDAVRDFWELIRNTTDRQVLEAFLRRNPKEPYAQGARDRLAALDQSTGTPAPAPKQPSPPPSQADPPRPPVRPPATARFEIAMPSLVYRTGAYAPNGIQIANGIADYYTLINERDGGINGGRIVNEECETGYATDKGMECYERLRTAGAAGAGIFAPPSTGMTFAMTERAPADKVPLLTLAQGRSESRDGTIFPWNFPILGTHWTATSIIVQHIAQKEGGAARLRGKTIGLVYHDSPFGKEPIPILEALARKHGFQLAQYPVTHPGVEQKSQWLAVRQRRPDYVILQGWGVMNSVAIREAAAVAYPRDKIFGMTWASSETDVSPAGDQAHGYNAVALHGSGLFEVHNDLRTYVYDRNKGRSQWSDTGNVYYVRGLITAMISVEAVRAAQERFGNKALSGEQVRWGLEHLNLTADRLAGLGFGKEIAPIATSCADHEGARSGRIQQWDGVAWKIVSGWYTADEISIGPILRDTAAKYASDKKLVPRDCSRDP